MAETSSAATSSAAASPSEPRASEGAPGAAADARRSATGRDGEAPPDLFVLSDLHLSAGVAPDTQRTARLETFFYDREFSDLVDRIIVSGAARRRRIVLVLNGDVFDFLGVVRLPTAEECARHGIHVSRRERKYGLDAEAHKDAWKMRVIIRGHPEFFRALLRLLRAGHSVHVNRGNHDAELYWPEVREAFYEELTALAERERVRLRRPDDEAADGGGDEAATPGAIIRDRMRFHDWFYHEPGRVWLEHGHQYEASNSFRFLLNPVIRRRRGGRPSIDLPTGSLFVRYVYNRFKLVDPYSTQVFTLEQYLDVISSYNVMDLAKALMVHFPFFVRALKQARIFEVSGMADIGVLHRRRLESLSRESGLGDKLERIDGMRSYPIGVTKYGLFREMMRPIVRSVITILLLALVSIGGWMLLFSLIQNTQWLADSVLGKASLMAVLAVLTIVGLFVGGTWVSRRFRHVNDTIHDELRRRAQALGDLLDVRFVSFGHTHWVDRRKLRNGRIYANSGTWTSIRGPWDAIRPFGRQFTFLYIHDDELEALRWHDAAARWEPVTFLEDHEPTSFERLLADPDPPAPPHT